MAAPKEVRELVEKFRRARAAGVNETQLRREYLDPFFAALGWDVENKKGSMPHLREVTHEYPQDVEGSQKTADYLFRRGEKPLFFVEAKKPGVSLKDDAKGARQIRSYAFSAGHALGVLTDFEEFAVYDGRVKPKAEDKAPAARVLYLTCDEYLTRWDEFAGVFSYDAAWKTGGFDKFAGEAKGGPHVQVGKEFLKTIERWRDELARNLANRNKDQDLTARDLNYAVQATIDRTVFLKVCEDRRLEEDGRLKKAAAGDGVYARLLALFREADDKYNSGLFHFRDEKGRATVRDTLTPRLALDDKVLKGIVGDLYDGAYAFGVIPVEIIGQVYEQFLGKVIRMTPGGLAKVEDKPEVKKAGGVYYTPQYVVSYIVANTVGELLKKCRTPADAAKLRILDPACGSGSFLLGAYQALLDWHLAWYVKDGAAKYAEVVVPTGAPGANAYRLAGAEKRRILLNNLYGVDIDAQAVEVTKLSLLLRALEGETRESLGVQKKLLHDRALPDLGANVKCGNSLIGPDYFAVGQAFLPVRGQTRTSVVGQTRTSVVGQTRTSSQEQTRTSGQEQTRTSGQEQTGMSVPQDDEYERVNPFDWGDERYGFGAIMKQGGFDAVIGNPPYQDITVNTRIPAELSYYTAKYETLKRVPKKNTFLLFIEKGLSITKKPGLFSFIVPEGLARTRSYAGTRIAITDSATIEKIAVFDRRVFKEAFIGNIVFVLTVGQNANSYTVEKIGLQGEVTGAFEIALTTGERNDSSVWALEPEGPATSLARKLERGSVRAGDILKFYKGMVVKDRTARLRSLPKKKDLPFILGSSIKKYSLNYDYYTDYRELVIVGGTKDINKHLEIPRILIRRTGNYLCATYTDEPQLVESTLYIGTGLKADELKYYLGLINSRVSTFYIRIGSITNPQVYPQILMSDITGLPLKTGEESIKNKKVREEVTSLVERMLDLHKRKQAAKTPQAQAKLEEEVAGTDRAIDALVYELYGLTAAEIKIVES